MTDGADCAPSAEASRLSPLISLLRCLECGAEVVVAELAARAGYPDLGPDGRLRCTGCGEEYPNVAGTVRMLDPGLRERLASDYPEAQVLPHPATRGRSDRLDPEQVVKQRTGASFAYEWQHFGDRRPEWEKNFEDYMRPHAPADFRDRLVLDVGAGSGRHSGEAARLGARVVAVDIGGSIDVARRNLPTEVLTVQADAERLPFPPGSFDFVIAIGVLHHLPDPERGLRKIVPFARPGGTVHIYLYWLPPMRSHRAVLRVVAWIRHITARLPHPLLHLLCYPLAAVLYASVVVPYRVLRRHARTVGLARRLPLKMYADYPFGVLVNDQFDRFSAPLEHRYLESEVRDMLIRSGLTAVTVLPRAGWLGDGRVPG
jgi:SAM-dependent methyltransferase